MFNRFASKAIVPVAFSLTGFIIVCSLILYSSIKEGFMRSVVRQETMLADTVVSSTLHHDVGLRTWAREPEPYAD